MHIILPANLLDNNIIEKVYSLLTIIDNNIIEKVYIGIQTTPDPT